MGKKTKDIIEFLLFLIGFFLMMSRGKYSFILYYIGFILIIRWLFLMTKKNARISKYLNQRITFESLLALSISVIGGLVVIFFFNRDILVTYPDNRKFWTILLVSTSSLIISEYKLGKMRSRK